MMINTFTVLLFLRNSRSPIVGLKNLPSHNVPKPWTTPASQQRLASCVVQIRHRRQGRLGKLFVTPVDEHDYVDDDGMIGPSFAQEELKQDLDEACSRTATTTKKYAFAESQRDKFVAATVLSIVGFLRNTLIGLKEDTVRQLAESFFRFLGLLSLVLDDNFSKIFLNPKSLLDFLIMSRVIQKDDKERRDRVQLKPPPLSQSELPAFLSDSVHYMRYATAAYGVDQIKANEQLARMLEIDKDKQASKEERQTIANYTGVELQDILYASARGGNEKLINHVVSVDRKRNEVVLSIRGTYSVAGINTDLDAKGVAWYGGKAHGGFVERAKQLLENEKTLLAIARGFEILQQQNNGGQGKLKLVGHSLGAGIACLLNVAIQTDATLFQNKYSSLECYGYACPPAFTFSGHNATVESTKLFDNCYCYIHQQDTVPFLSVDAGQRLFKTMIQVRETRKTYWLLTLVLMAFGWWEIPDTIKEIVKEGSNDLPEINGDRLQIPAHAILWMRLIDDTVTSQYDYAFCNRTALSMLSVNTDFPAMLLDHFPPGYDVALTSIEKGHSGSI